MRFNIPDEIAEMIDKTKDYMFFDRESCCMRLRDDAPEEIREMKAKIHEWNEKIQRFCQEEYRC